MDLHTVSSAGEGFPPSPPKDGEPVAPPWHTMGAFSAQRGGHRTAGPLPSTGQQTATGPATPRVFILISLLIPVPRFLKFCVPGAGAGLDGERQAEDGGHRGLGGVGLTKM